jgi:CBS domain containing-hemolysin-like protein
MSALMMVLIALLVGVLALAAYIDRVYSEMGKFLAREYQDNIDSWEERVEPRLKLSRESLAQSASVLRQLSLAAIALLFGIQLLASIEFGAGPDWQKVIVTLCELVLVILIFDRLVPQVLFSRTRGRWVVRIRYLLQALFLMILPVTLLLGLLLSIAALAEPEDAEDVEHPSEAMDALLEAGEEEGILEESDRELVRSVVEFGDKVVREVMTPRPEVFAVPLTLTLKEFTEAIEEHVFSRVPVYRETLDNITGIAFAHDLLQVTDQDAETRTIAQIQRPAAFVPETKMVAELLREMQSEKQHMRIVIDEYGSVAGVVTIEDLLEAIVGSISDEHDEPEEDDSPVREESGAYVVSGTFELSRLRELFADQFTGREDGEGDDEGDDDPTALRLPEHYESTTVGGLVSEIAGHIPLPGEVVEEDGLRLEVLASTDRRIDRIRVSLANGDGTRNLQ